MAGPESICNEVSEKLKGYQYDVSLHMHLIYITVLTPTFARECPVRGTYSEDSGQQPLVLRDGAVVAHGRSKNVALVIISILS